MMQYRTLVSPTTLGLLLLLPYAAWAEYYVCGDATKFDQAFYRDPSFARPAQCSQVPEGEVEAQRTLIAAVPTKYLIVMNGRAVEMTQGAKDAVDAALATEAAARQALKDELASNAACSLTNLAEVVTYLDNRHTTIANQIQTLHDTTATQISGIAAANLASLKAGLNGLNDQDKTIADGVNGELTAVQKVIAKCVLALLRLSTSQP